MLAILTPRETGQFFAQKLRKVALQVLGFYLSVWHYFICGIRHELQTAVEMHILPQLSQALQYEKSHQSVRQQLMLVIGVSQAGKTYFIQKNGLPGRSVHIDNGVLQDAVWLWLRRIGKVKDRPNSLDYWLKNWLVWWLKTWAQRRVFRTGVPVIIDSCALTPKVQNDFISHARRYGYEVTMAVLSCHPLELRDRLDDKDDELVGRAQPRTYLEQYLAVQRPLLVDGQVRLTSRADRVIKIYKMQGRDNDADLARVWANWNGQ